MMSTRFFGRGTHFLYYITIFFIDRSTFFHDHIVPFCRKSDSKLHGFRGLLSSCCTISICTPIPLIVFFRYLARCPISLPHCSIFLILIFNLLPHCNLFNQILNLIQSILLAGMIQRLRVLSLLGQITCTGDRSFEIN